MRNNRLKQHFEVRNAVPRSQIWVQVARSRKYSLQELAKYAGVTVRQLERYFHEDFGRSPLEWLNELRQVDARHLLRECLPVKEIAERLGYKQASHFCREFKRVYGMTPTQMKRLLLSNGASEVTLPRVERQIRHLDNSPPAPQAV